MAEIRVPELAESITEATVSQWFKNQGDYVQKGETLVELETDKVNVEIISEFTGVLTEVKYSESSTVKIGETIAVVLEGEKSGEEDNLRTEEVAPIAEVVPPQDQIIRDVQLTPSTQPPVTQVDYDRKKQPVASPAARKLAREKGIDLTQIIPRDPLGRVRSNDLASVNLSDTKANTSNSVPIPIKKDEVRPVERIRMTRRRQTIAARLVEVQQTAAMLTTFNEVDMTAILNLRKRRKDKFFADHDVKLGFMSFFTKAVVASLKKNPLLNAEIHGDEIVIKKFYDIGIAVSAPEGLVVPVVRDAERKNFVEIEKEILELAEKARSNKLALSDLQGGTFTITNGGVFGSLLSTPILNGPQVGILGMHKIQLRPIAIDEDRIENRPMMYIALSYDHRIVDGKEAVTFLVRVKELLEDPESLLFEA